MRFTAYSLLCVLFLQGESLLIPIPLENPHPINPHELVCHYGLPIGKSTSGTRYSISAHTPAQTSHAVEGYLCSKTIWESKCDEGFFGGSTKYYIIHKSPVSDGECLEAYKKMIDGEAIPNPHFPPEYCSWMAVSSKSENFVTLAKHNVYRDPYKNMFVDHVLLGHKCSGVICPTHYDNIKWITGVVKPRSCTKWYTVEGEITLDPTKNLEWSYIETEFIPRTPLSKACYGASYCGTVGYVLENGLFFSIIPSPGSSFNIGRDIPVRTCPANQEISLHPLSSSLASVELQTIEILFNTKCNDVVSKIKNGLNVTVYELGFLSPTNPGIGHSFINIKGRLFSANTKFEPIKNYHVTLSESPTIGYLSKNNLYERINVNNCTWFKSSNGSMVCRWFNGILVTQDQVIPPYSTREEYKIEYDLYAEIQPNFDKHIGIPDIDNDTIHTSDQVTDPDYKNADLIGSIRNWFLK